MSITKIISICFGFIANFRFYKPLQTFINMQYVKIFKIDLDEFAPIESYPNLNALFTRGLTKIRKFSKEHNIFISPCDSLVMECGIVQNNKALQIKGYSYSVKLLLNEELDSSYFYTNLYLSPSNYHRYHSPCDMMVESITHFKGALLPVNLKSLNKNTNLFIHNERVVLRARDTFGNIIYFVAVGALNVGQIVFYIEPRLNENYKGKSQTFTYKDRVLIKKGEELGMFKMGSTIVLFAKDVQLVCKENSTIRFGENLLQKK